MKKPYQKDDAFLNDVRSRTNDDFRLWWMGQSGFLLQWNGRHLLLDPYLSDSLTIKYHDTDKPHVRMTERVIGPEGLGFVDVITSSHNHTDHLDTDTINPIRCANPALNMVIPEANRTFVADRLQCDPAWPIGLADGTDTTCAGFHITGIPAAHETLSTNDIGQHHYLGFIVRFDTWTLYHSGDTVWYDEMVDKLRHYDIDIALLPINGRSPARRVAGNLDGVQAACLSDAINASLIIPCHYDMFAFNTASTTEFENAARNLQQAYCILRNGEAFNSSALT